MSDLSLDFFGPIEVRYDGEEIDITARKALALLAYLAVTKRAQSRQRLASLLWPEADQLRARTNLRGALWTLNQTPLEGWIEATDEAVEVRCEDADIDVVRFETLVERDDDVTALAEGIRLYRGDFLDDFYLADNSEFEAWAAARRDHYRRRALAAMRKLAQHRLEAGEYGQARALARRQIAIDDLRESAYRQLFLALAGSGQRAVALKEYEGLRAHLDEEVGVAPSQATEAVVERIRAGEVGAEGMGAASPPAMTEDSADLPWQQREALPASPYRGLLAFREEDAPSFFGREAITAQLKTAVHSQPLVALVGPSGSGKTSVVYAGLVASLRPQERWLIASIRPGNRPFQALAGGLMDLLEPELSETERLLEMGKLATALTTGQLTLQNVVERIVDTYQGPSPARLLLVADQFEELYASVPDASLHRRFLEALLDVVFDQEFRRHPLCTVVITLRADFLGRALSYRPLANALQGADVKLGPMTRPELESAIVNPARKQGAGFAPGLVARILDDVGQEPGNLPLLSFTLDSLWELQEEGRLTHVAYEEIGKVQGALGRHGDAVLAGLGQEEQALARRIFVQLVHPGKGTEGTRRLARRAELGDEAWQLVQRLADSRLLVTGRDAAGRETVEVVHEALIRDWEQLQEWLDEDRSFRIWQEQLRASLRGWEAHDRDEGALLRGVALEAAEKWLERRPHDLSGAEREYIAQSRAVRQRRRAREKRAQAERERLRRTRTWILGAGLLLTALLAVLAGIQWWRAERQRQALADAQATILQERDLAQQALSGQLAAEVGERLDGDLDLALLLALEATARSDNPDARQSLADALQRTPRLRARTAVPDDALQAAAMAPDGRLLATGGEGSEIQLWQVDPLSYGVERLATLATASENNVRALAFGPDGRALAAVQLDAVSLYDLAQPSRASREILLSSEGSENGDTIADVAFGPDGEFLAIGIGGEIQLWDLVARRRIKSLAVETGNVNALAFTPEGERVVAGTDEGALLAWNLDSGESRRADVGIDIFGVAVSPDGAHVAVAGQPSLLEVWQLAPLQAVAVAEEVEANILFDVSFGDDGRLVSAGSDGHLVLWQVDGEELVPEVLPAHEDAVRAVALDGRGRRLAAAGLDGLITLWNTEPEPSTGLRLEGHAGAVHGLAFVEEQRLASVTCEAWTAFALRWDFHRACTWMETALWQTSGTTGAERLLRLDRHPAPITGLDLVSGQAVAGYEDGAIPFWDVATGRQAAVLQHQRLEQVVSFAFEPGGGLVATGGCLESNPNGSCREGGVRLWQREQPQARRLLRGFEGTPGRLALSPDGRWLAASIITEPVFHLLLWDLNQEEPQPRRLDTGGRLVLVLAFHPHDNLLFSGDGEGEVKRWRLPQAEAGQVVGTLDGTVLALAVSPDGRYLAMAGCATPVPGDIYLPDCPLAQLDVLDRETGRLLPRPFLGHSRAILSLAFNQDGSMLASGDFGGDIMLWDLSATPQQVACRRAGRNLTQEEWERYFGEEPYRPTCPEEAIPVNE